MLHSPRTPPGTRPFDSASCGVVLSRCALKGSSDPTDGSRPYPFRNVPGLSMLAFSHSDRNLGLASGKLNGRRRRSKETCFSNAPRCLLGHLGALEHPLSKEKKRWVIRVVEETKAKRNNREMQN